jgi:hypothetical protein
MALHACLIVLMLLATVLTPLLGTVPLRGWRWDRQVWWLLGLLSIGMPLAAGHHFARILLPGVGAMFSAISLAGLDAMLRAEREGAPAPALWWRQLARAFAVAGLWVMLALAHAAFEVKGTAQYSSRAGCWLAELLATGMVGSLLFALGAHDHSPGEALPPGSATPARAAGGAFARLGLLCVVLFIPWAWLRVIGVDVLGYLGFDGFIGYAGVTCLVPPEHVVARSFLACLATVTLLLWAFQALCLSPSLRRSGVRTEPPST